MKHRSLLEQIFSTTERVLFSRTPVFYRAVYSIYKNICDRGEQELIKAFIRPGMIAIDIGANIGIYSEFLLKLVGPNGEVHAFEPDKINFRLLCHALSCYNNVFLNQAAIGDKTSDIFLHVSRTLNVDHKTYECGEERQKVSILGIALDDYISKVKSVDFIKIDIQGYEYHALSGMRRVLHDNKQIKLLIEYFPSGLKLSGYSGLKLRTFLIEAGFCLYSVSSNGNLVPLKGKEPNLNSLGYTNLFAYRN